MKILRYILFTVAAAVSAAAAEPLFVTAGPAAYAARPIDNAKAGTVSGVLIYGGLGDTPMPAWSGKIVLLNRGTISFAAKVKAVQDMSGLAVIVANNVTLADSATLGDNNTSTIPAVTISQTDGVALVLLEGTTVRVGTALPPVIAAGLPDPKGHKGEYLAVGDDDKYVLVKMDTAPSISVAGDVDPGKPLSFVVSATGPTPFFYQWNKDGVDIPGATGPSFVILSAQPTDAGRYYCQVTNPQGTTPSGSYTLTVAGPAASPRAPRKI